MTVDVYWLIKQVGVNFPWPEDFEVAIYPTASTVFLSVLTMIETEFEPVSVYFPVKITVGSNTGSVGWDAISGAFAGMCAIPAEGGMETDGFFAYPESGISGSVNFFDPARKNVPGTSDYPMIVIMTAEGPVMVTGAMISDSEYRLAIVDFEGVTHTYQVMNPFYQPIQHNDGGLLFFTYGTYGLSLKKTKPA